MNSRYNQGPAPVVRLLLESSAGYTPHSYCNGLRGYNLTSGYDEGFNGQLDADEVLNVDYLCTTNQTIQGGNGRVSNGSVVNGSFLYSQQPIPEGNGTCQFGGKSFTWGNDYGLYYDEDTSLNSTETEATMYFCNRDSYWDVTNFDLGGNVTGTEQVVRLRSHTLLSLRGNGFRWYQARAGLTAGVDTWFNFLPFQYQTTGLEQFSLYPSTIGTTWMEIMVEHG